MGFYSNSKGFRWCYTTVPLFMFVRLLISQPRNINMYRGLKTLLACIVQNSYMMTIWSHFHGNFGKTVPVGLKYIGQSNLEDGIIEPRLEFKTFVDVWIYLLNIVYRKQKSSLITFDFLHSIKKVRGKITKHI